MCKMNWNTNNNPYANIDYSLLINRNINLSISEEDAKKELKVIRWNLYGGKPLCVNCGSSNVSSMQRSDQYFCRACSKQFKEFSKTILASTKMPFRIKLNAITDIVRDCRIVDLNRYEINYISMFTLFYKVKDDFLLYNKRKGNYEH